MSTKERRTTAAAKRFPASNKPYPPRPPSRLRSHAPDDREDHAQPATQLPPKSKNAKPNLKAASSHHLHEELFGAEQSDKSKRRPRDPSIESFGDDNYSHGPAPPHLQVDDLDSPPSRHSRSRKSARPEDNDERPPKPKRRRLDNATVVESDNEDEFQPRQMHDDEELPDAADDEEELPDVDDNEEPQPRVKSLARQSRKKGAKKKKTTRSRLDASNLNSKDRRIYDASRMLARTAHPFISFRGVLDVKIDELAGQAIHDDDLCYLKTYDILAAAVPELDDLLDTHDYERVDEVVRIDAANQAKHADTALIRTQIERLIPLDQTTSISPRFHEKLKVDRGFFHTETRALLTAQDRCNELTNPRFVSDLKNGKISFTFEDYPALMYDQAKTDPEDGEAGLFEGHVPIRVLRTVLNGKSQAYAAAHGIKGSNAERKNLKTITGRLIAYAHVQSYFACTTAEKWVEKVGTFDLRKWYDDMVEMFEEDPEDEKVKAIVELWNKEIFGTDRLQDISNRASGSNPNSRSAKLKATRLARQKGRAPTS
ncbi:hypothetical protein C8F01DRAFT_1375432 [Mycena amicta]|nr:hypothetical protein C8F01DRAFT_1375432 [Mycena amicta]